MDYELNKLEEMDTWKKLTKPMYHKKPKYSLECGPPHQEPRVRRTKIPVTMGGERR